MLQLKHITKDYFVGTQVIHALRGVSVDFRKNEFVAVLGPSGCGKTTLMNITGGLDRYTAGDLIINGRSTRDFSGADWDNYRNKKIGFVFQSYNLIPHLTVLGNVEIALTISGISKNERKERAKAALTEVGLTDQMHQRPNQLSGGQMQRVAIARALVNSPEILLADEPTGALDTETSIQIMSLIKEISKNRLVIMVTHNPDLAKFYATRVIRMIDGVIFEDSNPYHAEADPAFVADSADARRKEAEEKAEKKTKEKSAMSYATALSLSWKNLKTKKGRTTLTSIAGSIGIIGIALILALTGGLNNYIAKMQADTLASNPITISSMTLDMEQAMTAMGTMEVLEKFPSAKEIYVQKAFTMSDIMRRNNLTQEYIDYITRELDADWYNDITFKTGQVLTIYGQKPNQTAYSKIEGLGMENYQQGGGMFSSGSTPVWQMMLKSDFINSQYDILEGKFPENKNEIALIVSDTNEIPEETLIALGLRSAGDEDKKYSFSDFLGKEYKVAGNDIIYERIGSNFSEKSPLDIDFTEAQSINIAGILRIKQSTESGVLTTGIGYMKELYSYVQDENAESEIVSFMDANHYVNPFTGIEYEATLDATKDDIREAYYRAVGGEKNPNEINIYPTSFDAKNSIKKVLNNYNKGRDKDEMITYLDMSELIGEALNSVIGVISGVLMGFTAISLLVSSIMIAIITYVSVLERTKEIGILRSIGARKKDVTRVFNAETIIIGFIAGLIGVGVTYILSVPINLIAGAMLSVSGIASLNPLYALILIGISTALTLVSGLIPAFKAANKDPVTALRTE